MSLIPPELSIWAAAALIAVSFIASALTAAIGLGGGVLMLAAMGNLMPAAAIVPVHAVVQLGSNAGRSWLLKGSIERRYILPFGLGSVLGVTAGASVYVALPVDLIRLILGLFILQTIWLPLPFLERLGRAGTIAAGAVAAFLTLFIGATGPFVASIWQVNRLGKKARVATHAAAMTLQHGIKIVAFGILGFAFGPWLPWVALVILAGLAGSWAGTQVLERTPDTRFEILFKWTLTALATALLWQAVRALAA